MRRILTLTATLLLIGTAMAKDNFPLIKKAFGARGQADAEALIKFYEKEIPGYLKMLEADLAEITEADPEERKEVFAEIKEQLGEFYGEYRELRLEEPEEARKMLETKRSEVSVEVKAAAVRDARKKKAPNVKKLETALKVEIDRLFDHRLDELRGALDAIAGEEREEGLDAEGKEEKAHIERMLSLKTKHRKLIMEVAFLRAVEGEELLEL